MGGVGAGRAQAAKACTIDRTVSTQFFPPHSIDHEGWVGTTGAGGYMDGGKGGAMTANETTPMSDGYTDLPAETRLSPLFAHTELSCASGSSP